VPTAGAAINIISSNFGHAENLIIEKPRIGVLLQPKAGAAVNKSCYYDIVIGGHEVAGFYLDGLTAPVIDVVIQDCTITGFTGTGKGPGVGVYITGQCEGNFIRGGDFILQQRGIWVTNTSLVHPKHPSGVHITDCQCDSNVFGITIDHCVWAKLAGCWMSTSENHGLYVSDTYLLDVADCMSYNNTKAGVYCEATTKHARIHDNQMFGNSRLAANQWSGIMMAANTTDFSITNNVSGCDGAIPTTSDQRYGIEVGTGASNRYIITGNRLIGNQTGTIFDGGNGASKIVSGNI